MGVVIPQVVTEDRASGAQVIDGSLKFNGSQELTFTPSSSGNLKTATWSFWVKRTKLSSGNDTIFGFGPDAANDAQIYFNSSDKIYIFFRKSSSSQITYQTTRVFRDTGWYHIVMSVDTTQASGQVQLYVDGTEVTAWDNNTDTTQNADLIINDATFTNYIGRGRGNVSVDLDCMLSNVYLIDGQALGPEYFGFTDPLTGTWRPKKYTGTFSSSAVAGTGTLTNYDNNTQFPTYSNQGGGSSTIANVLKAFDGDNSTYADMTYLNGQYARLTFENPITNVTNITIGYDGEGDPGYNGANHQTSVSFNGSRQSIQLYNGSAITLNNLDFITQPGNGLCRLYDVTITTTTQSATELTLSGASPATGVNSFYLPMDGNSPIGKDKSGIVTPNDGTIWSSTVSGGIGPYSNGFDGSLSTYIYPRNQDAQGNLVFAGGLACDAIYCNTYSSSGTEFYTDSASSPTSVNTSNSFAWVALPADATVINQIKGTGGPGYDAFAIAAFRKDGHILIDGQIGNSWTPVNFGGSNSIEKATGAFPILNTDGGGKIANVGVRTDSNYSNLVLALPLVGSTNDVSNQINSGTSTKTITNTGTAAASSAQSNFYGGSFYFDGSNDKLTSGTVSINQADFTVEAWVYFTNADTSNETVVEFTGTNRWIFGRKGTGSSSVMYIYDGSGERLTSTSVNDDAWHHMAWVKDGGIVYFYLDGIQIGSYGGSYGTTNSSTITVGRNADNFEPLQGYIQDVRVYNSAKYTSNFIPASTNPDILPDTPSGVSGGSKLTKVIDGAVAFDGTGDYLSIPDSSDFAFGTGDFTAECFIYPQGNVSYRAIIDCRDATTQATGWILGVDVNDNIYIYNDGFLLQSGSGVTPENRWFHVAYVRNSGTHALYVDGKSVATSSSSYDYTVDNCVIGASYAKNAEYWNGFISNVRLIKGTALYTSDFTPPERTLTNVTNTKLLCCQSNVYANAATVSPTLSGINANIFWSSLVNAPGGYYDSSHQTGWLFNGDTSGNSDIIPADGGNRWTLTYDFGSVTTLEFFTYYPGGSTSNGANAFEVNGSTVTPISKTQGGWTSLPIAGGTLTSFGSKTTSVSGQDYCFVSAIRVDGTILLDSIGLYGDASATNFNPFITDINAVRGQESGYCTMNPLFLSDGHTFTDGNLTVTHSTNAHQAICGDFAMSSGKWYWEYTWNSGPSGNLTGIWKTDDYTIDRYTGGTSSSYGYYSADGNKYNNSSASSYGSSWTTGDVIGNAFDADSGTLTFYKNGASQGVAYNSISVGNNVSYFPSFSKDTSGTNTCTCTLNFGQKPFKYAPPEGFQPLNSANVRPETVIARPDQYVGVTTYTGNGGTIGISSYSFKPDFVWTKSRTSGYNNALFDSVRGATYRLSSDTQSGSNADATTLTAFTNNGFTGGNSLYLNGDGEPYVAWAWKAGGNSNTFNIDDVGYATASAAGLAAGALNSSVYDQSQTWSTYLTFTNDGGGYLTNRSPADVSFDGDINEDAATSTTGTSAYIEVSGFSLTSSDTLEVLLLASSPGSLSWDITGTNLTTTTISTNAQEFVNIPITGNATAFRVTQNSTGRAHLCAVRINGKELVDSGDTPRNFPSITPTGASVGTKQGFSIIKYDGTGTSTSSTSTISHGLSQAPTFLIVKAITGTNAADDWFVYHKDVGITKRIRLNLTNAADTQPWLGNPGTLPTSSLVTITQGWYSVNYSGHTHIMYAWHDVPGLQKFGSYIAGSEPFVELGFKPAIVMIKCIGPRDTAFTSWYIADKERSQFNPSRNPLWANKSASEGKRGDGSTSITNPAMDIDLLSNGFKIKDNGDQGDEFNYGGSTYIYAAWAEAPSFNLYGGGANAR